MKESKTQLRRALEAFVDNMTDEEFAASLEKAGLEFYKNVKVPVFSGTSESQASEELLLGPFCVVSPRISKPTNYITSSPKANRPMPKYREYTDAGTKYAFAA